MTSTDPTINGMRKRAISRLLERRKALQRTAEELASTPASYGITGSVNVTNRDPDQIRAEIAEIDQQLKTLLAGGNSGISLSYPDYRIKWPL